ncbi:MAG: hypothetical protein Q9221_008322 [Calogaya cf. arnoldii]
MMKSLLLLLATLALTIAAPTPETPPEEVHLYWADYYGDLPGLMPDPYSDHLIPEPDALPSAPEDTSGLENQQPKGGKHPMPPWPICIEESQLCSLWDARDPKLFGCCKGFGCTRVQKGFKGLGVCREKQRR